MYRIVRSITDVITNSSSEVYIMDENTAEFFRERSKEFSTNNSISLTKIDWEWVMYEGDCYEDMVLKVCGLVNKNIRWMDFLNENRDTIEEKLIGKYFVDIEDNYDEYFLEDRAMARNHALGWESAY